MGIFGKGMDQDEYVELEVEGEELPSSTVSIEIETMTTFADSERIQKKVREGSILLVKIKDMKSKNAEDLKKAISKVKKTCMAIDGDIAGIGEDFLLLTPANAKIQRPRAG